MAVLEGSFSDLHRDDPSLRKEQGLEAQRAALIAERSALEEDARTGLLAEETLRELVGEVDSRLEDLLADNPT